MAPQKIPKTFLLVTGSFRNRGGRRIAVMMGRVVVDDAGVDLGMLWIALSKQHWLNTMHSIPAKKTSVSPGSDIFFMSAEKEVEPKHVAPTARKFT